MRLAIASECEEADAVEAHFDTRFYGGFEAVKMRGKEIAERWKSRFVCVCQTAYGNDIGLACIRPSADLSISA